MEPVSATSAFLISVIASVLGNRSDDLLYKSQDVLKRMFNNLQAPTNQEIQCAVRRAYLKATLLTCKSLKKNKYNPYIPHHPKYLSDINSYLRQEIRKLDKEKTFVTPSDFDSNFETLLQPKGVSTNDRLPELILILKQSILRSLEVPPFQVKEELKTYVLEGWENDGKHVDWYELMCAFFQEEFKNNPHLSTIIQTNLLTKLNQDISGLQLSLDVFMKPLQDFFEEYKGILPILDEINEKLDRNFEAVQNLEAKVDNIQAREATLKSTEHQYFVERIEELRDLVKNSTDDTKRLKYSKRVSETEAQFEAFKRDVIQLAETFQNANLDNEIINLAKQKYDEGKFKEARLLLETEQITNGLDTLLERNQKVQQDLKDKAEELLLLAQLTAMDYDLGEKRYETAKEYFKKSIEANRNPDNLFRYGFFLQSHNQYPVQPYYEEALSLLKSEEDSNSKIIRSKIGLILNSLGSLNQIKNNFKYAEQSYEKALDVYDKLNREEDNFFLVDIGMVLNNLGCIYHINHNFPKAEKTLKEALGIRRALATNDEKYLFDVAMTLNNLGSLYMSSGALDESETVLTEALNIRRQLAKINPNIYLRDVGMTLANMAILYDNKKEIDKARHSFQESLDIYRKLSNINPYTYLPDLGSALNSLGNFNYINENLKDAGIQLKEALKIRKKLAANTPDVYLPDISTTLTNLGNVCRDKKEFKEAETYYQEALTILKKLADVNPQVHLPNLAAIMVNISRLYCYDYPKKEESVSLALNVIKIVARFQHIPRVMLYGGAAVQILQKWGIGIEDLIGKNENPK